MNASHHCQIRSIDCSGLQNGCQLHYHTADSVLTSGCSFIRQHIWIEICIALDILGRYIERKWFSTGKKCIWMRISWWQIDDFESMSSGCIAGWGGLCSGQRCRQLWRWLWSLLSASVGWRNSWSLASPACLRIFCRAIWARKASWLLVFDEA